MHIDQIIRSRRKTFALIVTPDGRIIVRAPLNANRTQIEQLVAGKADWIRDKQEQIAKSAPRRKPKRFVEGEIFLFQGAPYSLSVVDQARSALVLKDRFYISRRFLPNAEAVFTAWYRAQARSIITERVRLHAARNGFAYRSIRITSARTRWGSCGVRGTLNFSWRLVMAPLSAIDYVVIHELVHLEVKNHSQAFWERVGALAPDYQEQVAWLKANGHELAW